MMSILLPSHSETAPSADSSLATSRGSTLVVTFAIELRVAGAHASLPDWLEDLVVSDH